MRSTRSLQTLAASGLLALLPGSAGALDASKLPSGNDHEQAHPLSQGDGVPVGIIEAPESVTNNKNVDTAQSHFDTRLVEKRDFSGTAPPLASLPAQATGNGSAHTALVGDVALGDDSTYTGVAKRGDFFGGWTPAYNNDRAAFDIYERSEGVYIFNASWGVGSNTNGTSQYSLFFDWFVSNKDVVVVKSAGNSGGQISIPGDAFNLITVGGLDSVDGAFKRRRSSSSYLLMGDDGSTAPDARGKPEIVAPGQKIGNGFVTQSGTSHAAPHVAGISALLVEVGLTLPGPAQRSRLAHKAIILNSARKRRINPPDPNYGLALDYTSTDTQPSDDDYLEADGSLRVGMTGGGGPKTDAWTPSSWVYSGGIFLTDRPLDDELGTGVADAQRALIQHEGGEQGPSPVVSPMGWNRDCLNEGRHSYTLSGTVPEGRFLTATLSWDRAVDSSDGDQVVESTDIYTHKTDGLGFLPDFDLEIRELTGSGSVLLARSMGIGGDLAGQNVEHLHVPVPRTGVYQIRVVLAETETSPECIDYGLAWWGPSVIELPAGSASSRAGLALLLAGLAGLALARRRRV